jgi:hypothetical protein
MSSQFRRVSVVSCVAVAALLGGCASTTHLEAARPGTTLALHGTGPMYLPQDRDLESKATGQYEFVATSPSGQTMYGILPLHVSGTKMAASILFFAPALFIGGFRDVMPFYQFDPDANELRYKSEPKEEWRVFKPLMVESARAKNFFEAHGICGGGNASKASDPEPGCVPAAALAEASAPSAAVSASEAKVAQ